MRNEIRLLTRLELRSLYGFNKFRYTKDRKTKNRYLLLMAAWLFIVLIVMAYVGGLVYGLSSLGLSEIVPSYLVMIASLLILAFGIFKAGEMIFAKKGYDFLCSLPVRQTSIVISRFLTMYVEDLALTFLIMLPGIVVYGICIRPTISFYALILFGLLFVPMIPLVISTLIGTLFSTIASRMKHKAIVQTLLVVVLIVVIMAASFQSEQLEETISPEMLTAFGDIIGNVIGKCYPPALWFGKAVLSGNISSLLLFMGSSMVLVFAAIIVVSYNFHKICRRLFATSATHSYEMKTLKSQSLLAALYQRELKRYFSSTIYVTNTIVGPILATIMSVALLITGTESLTNSLPIPLDITGLLPFAIAGVFCMMTTTSTSISMEGKEFWIIKTLPVPTKAVLDSKILLNLSLMLPFYVVSEICLLLALKVDNLDVIWIILIPALLILFSVVFGITINLKFHSFDWEKEETVVKQSASSMLGGFVGLLVAVVGVVLIIITPRNMLTLVKCGICLILGVLTVICYRHNNKIKLQCL